MWTIGLAALASAAAIQSDLTYRVEVLYQEKSGLRGQTVKLRNAVDLGAGSFQLRDGRSGGGPLLKGRAAVDGDQIQVSMTLCELGQSGCKAIAYPRVRFTKGRKATVRAETRSGVYYRITFKP